MATAKHGNHKSHGKESLKPKLPNATEVFEEALEGNRLRRAKYILRLYVTGSTMRSLRAITNLKKLCEEHLPDDYDLEVIDIYKNPNAAREEQIVAAPTLIKRLPRPLRRFVGDMSNTEKLLVGLEIYEHQELKDQLSGGH